MRKHSQLSADIYKENYRRMLANHYKRLTIATNGLPSIRMACDCLRICCEYAFFANFRSMFLIFVTPQNRARMLNESLRMLGDHAAIIANWWRVAFVSPFVRHSLRCKSSINKRIQRSQVNIGLTLRRNRLCKPCLKIIY